MKKFILSFIVIAVFILLRAQSICNVVVYDDAFEGKETASGDVFTQTKLTAAHESIPLGTEVELFYVQSGKKVRVIINDRLENAPDLFWISRAAMDSLEVYSLYPTEVLYTIPGKDLPPQTASLHSRLFASLSPNAETPRGDPYLPLDREKDVSTSVAELFGVQVYSTDKHSDTQLLSRRLQNHFDYLSYIEKVKIDNLTLYRLIIGDFEKYAEAAECLQKLQIHIPDAFIVIIN
ncbi:MAG: RlpA-like double-psi beta-barrel domain-containing protein [Fidelibacterota bacterium]